MSTTPTQPQDTETTGVSPTPRDAAYWAKPVDKLKVSDVPSGALNLNVEGRQLTGPLRGFGQMWQKTYRVRLTGSKATPAEVIQIWKKHFPEFWPKGGRFYAPLAGIAPGETALINARGPGNVALLSTGVTVIYADDESFTFMTPEGHPFNGMVTFSAYEADGDTVAQVQLLIRAYDPLYEIGFRLRVLHKLEDQTWHHTLKSLAARLGVQAQVQQQVTCVDPKVRWSQAKNIWRNAAIRTAIYTLMAPLRWVRNRVKR